MKQTVIVADDLTGACDSGVQLTAKGLNVIVSLDKEAPTLHTDVIIFDTDSRAMSKDEAYQTVKHIASKIDKKKAGIVYKKMDSTLRGNIGSEIDALMDQLSYDLAVIAPALPSLNRTTKNGIHYLNQIPIEKTEVAKDPKTPVTDSDIVSLLSNQSSREPVLFPRELLKGKKTVVVEKVESLLEQNKTLFVFDAENDQDLADIVACFKELPYDILWAGFAGLAEKLPVEEEMNEEPMQHLVGKQNSGPVLVVSGSRSSVTQNQMKRVSECLKIQIVELNPAELIDEEGRQSEMMRCSTDLNQYLKDGKDAILYVSQNESISVSSRDEMPYLISEALGVIVAGIVDECKLKGMVVAGGDTAKSISRELGVQGIQIIKEIEPGLPLSIMIGGPRLPIVTKAGAFGTKDSLYHALKLLKGELTS